MNKQAQAVVLLLVGGAVLRASFTDLYLRYVKQGLQPFLIAAGVMLVAAAVMTLWYELRPHDGAPAEHSHDDIDERGERAGSLDASRPRPAQLFDEHADHGHSGEPRVAWLLLLPVFGLLLVAPPALGSYAANRSGMSLQAQSDFAPLPAGDPAKISVLDYASRAIFDEGRSLGDRRVQVTGFVSASPDGNFYLTRMILSCCAADARPIKIAMSGRLPENLKQDTWLRVVGTYVSRTAKDPINGERIPFIEVGEAETIAAPSEEYEN
jgi:uncharacterized repeat protein (TIGR03943 family)